MTSQNGSTASSTEPLSWAPYETALGVGWIGWSGDVIDRMVLPGPPMPSGQKATPPPGVAGLAKVTRTRPSPISPRRKSIPRMPKPSLMSGDSII